MDLAELHKDSVGSKALFQKYLKHIDISQGIKKRKLNDGKGQTLEIEIGSCEQLDFNIKLA